MITPLRHTPLLPGTLQNLFYPPRENEYVYFDAQPNSPSRTATAQKSRMGSRRRRTRLRALWREAQ